MAKKLRFVNYKWLKRQKKTRLRLKNRRFFFTRMRLYNNFFSFSFRKNLKKLLPLKIIEFFTLERMYLLLQLTEMSLVAHFYVLNYNFLIFFFSIKRYINQFLNVVAWPSCSVYLSRYLQLLFLSSFVANLSFGFDIRFLGLLSLQKLKLLCFILLCAGINGVSIQILAFLQKY